MIMLFNAICVSGLRNLSVFWKNTVNKKGLMRGFLCGIVADESN
jgi:hypothetical protein